MTLSQKIWIESVLRVQRTFCFFFLHENFKCAAVRDRKMTVYSYVMKIAGNSA